MKVLRSWLEDYVKIKVDNEKLADSLSFSGTLVESVSTILDEKIIVGHIKDIKKHPNADRLQIATVYNGIEDLQVVCGAPNIAIGQKVPLAQIGTILPEIEIRRAEIRGIESFGMLCSEKELGLGEGSSGIKILPEDYIVGKSLKDYFTSDAIFELEITPNRGDCLSHFGVAREISAVYKTELEDEDIKIIEGEKSDLTVEIQAEDLCGQYYALPIKNVKIADSPQWLKNRLISLGQRPINNIVDITNYVMFDLGQPLHAFDNTKIKDQQIIIRRAKINEKIITLDQNERKLTDENLVISDSEKPIALAGIMGGANSEVDQNSVNIVLEAAHFESVNIRKTAKRLGLSTEASYRFERGIDESGIKKAIFKAAKLIKELAGGEIQTLVEAGLQPERPKVKIELEKINSLLGLSLEKKTVDEVLVSLGFEAEHDWCFVPLWRHDIKIWEDLAEEVGRIYGFDKIDSKEINKTLTPPKSSYYAKEFIKDILIENDFTESINYPYLSQEDLETANLDSSDLLEIANPLQKENKYLRSSLIPGLLKNIAKNPSFDQNLFFEIGNAFTKEKEITKLALVSAGKDAKKKIEAAIENILKVAPIKKDLLNVKELSREELTRFKIKKPVVFFAEVLVDEIIKNVSVNNYSLVIPTNEEKYRYVSKFPAATRDLAFVLNAGIDSSLLRKTILAASDKVLLVEVFDEFTSEKFGQGKKSVALHLWFQDLTKTIDDGEIANLTSLIINIIEQEFKAELRS